MRYTVVIASNNEETSFFLAIAAPLWTAFFLLSQIKKKTRNLKTGYNTCSGTIKKNSQNIRSQVIHSDSKNEQISLLRSYIAK